MQIEVQQSVLKAGLAAVSRAVAAKSPMTALMMVFFDANAELGKLRIAGTDLKLSVEYTVDCAVQQGGTALLPEKLLRDLVSNLSDGVISLKTVNNTVVMKSGRQTMNIAAGEPADFPTLPSVSAEQRVVFDRAVFAHAVGRIAGCAAAPESGRPVLEGVFFDRSGDLVTLTATDGMRLSSQSVPVQVEGDWTDVLIPATSLQEVARISAGSEFVAMQAAKAHVAFHLKNRDAEIVVSSRIIDGKYPDWRRVVAHAESAKNPAVFSVQRNQLMTAIRLAVPFAQNDHRRVSLNIRPEESVIVVSAKGGDVGTSESAVAAEFETGHDVQPFTVSAAAVFLIDVLNALSTPPPGSEEDREIARLSTESPVKPIVTRAAEFVSLVMPMA